MSIPIPSRLNQWLIANRGYANGNLMAFSALASFGVHFVAYIKCATAPAPMTRLIKEVQGGAGVLVCMDWQPGNALQPHWVYVTSLNNTGGQIMDPWQLPGRECVSLATYLAPGMGCSPRHFLCGDLSQEPGRYAVPVACTDQAAFPAEIACHYTSEPVRLSGRVIP